ncbi:nucleotidyltransferase family protein [Sulfurihydrogenibium yellowstonense]|jgi:Predicted nucleotidyltransferases|uniref:DNA polymerase beta domain protein region n=1 Tax=Sulfurihydrogenibium yellowstonense SS-5 TaxID=432331 RepID=C4FJ27_9AQUI|nr:nucleotidyltransferase family protein [Sulfurihydrogenibium yellowstonense]EEP60928.1 DNA polymerase beta domain protein region [Sulfurihydrogenibium yellowstonense SS-5]
MSNLERIKKILKEHKEEIREKYGVVIVGVFGSVARSEESLDSDVDILVNIEKPIGLKFFELWDYLETILERKVDLLTMQAVNKKPILKESIEKDLINV